MATVLRELEDKGKENKPSNDRKGTKREREGTVRVRFAGNADSRIPGLSVSGNMRFPEIYILDHGFKDSRTG
jgi:hypothetical protein